jgi:hypothetical protein
MTIGLILVEFIIGQKAESRLYAINFKIINGFSYQRQEKSLSTPAEKMSLYSLFSNFRKYQSCYNTKVDSRWFPVATEKNLKILP